MTDEQRETVRELVAGFDAPAASGGVFARTVADITGYTGSANLKLPPVNIPLVHDRPIKEPPRRYTGKEREEIDKKFNELKAANLIERAEDTNAYAMNVTVPSKMQPDGTISYHVCGDARRLNEATVCDGYQIPRIEDLFDAVASKAWITKADCRAAFAQLWLAEEDRRKTAFWWGRELWQHKRLLYGLRNATSHWQRVVDSHAREYGLEGVLFIYVDDCALVSNTFEEHLEHLHRFFTMMRDIGIKLHPDKTYLCADSIDYLGHQISGSGMSPVQARVAAFQALRAPNSLNACQRLLGLLNYYRCYIDHWAVKMAPITKLLKKDVVWGPETWGPEQQLALDTVKAEFAREGLILRAYDPSWPLILHTDWCEDGVSGVLGQLDDDAREYMVACVSRTCNVHERRYGSYKGELLAAVWAIQTLRPYLHATPFTLVTDHAPLEWLMSQPELTGQAARWAMILQQYSFSVVHRPGLLNQNADALSRDPLPTTHDSTGARLDNDDDPLPVPPQRVPYPGKGWPQYAPTPAPPVVAVTTLARAGMRTVLPPFAAALCSATTTPAVLLLHPAQPWAPASRLQFACLQATLTPAGDTTVPSPGELLHNEDDEHALRTAALIVVQQSRALRALSPAPRLRLRTSALHGSVVGVSTFLRQHALIFAAETDAISVLEVPGGLAPGLQACLRLGWRIRRYCNLDSSGTVREALSRLLPHLARLHPDLLPPPTPAAPARQDQPRGSATPAAAASLISQLPIAAGGQWLVIGGWGWSDHWGETDVLGLLGALQRHCIQRRWPAPAYVLLAPPTTVEHQQGLGFPFGIPVPFDLVQTGVGVHHACSLYTNLATAEHLTAVFREMRPLPQRRLPQLVAPGVRLPVAAQVEPLPHVPVHAPGQRLAALPAGATCIPADANAPAQPLSPRDWEVLLGHVPGASSGLPPSAALAALRSAPPPLALSAVLAAAVVLQRHYLTPHDTHTPPPQVLAPADAEPVLPLGGSDAEDTELARMLIQRQPGSDLLVFATMVAAQTDATEAALAAANGQQPDVWLDAEVMALIQGLAGQAAASRRAVRRASSYRWDGQQLLRCLSDGRARVCPPPAERLGIAERLHLSLGHLGVRRTRALLQLGYWWFDMGATAAHVVRNCRACDLSRVTGDARPAELQPLPVRGLFYRWGVDLAGELTPTEPDGYRYCVIAIEHFSKHIEVVPIVDKTADRVARVFADIMARFGAPAEVVTDNGSEFEGEFAALLERCYVDHRHASPGHPQADGAAERIVRVVKDALRKACYESADPARWDRALPHLLLGYRCSPQAATQYSPFRLLHGGVEPQVPAAVREGFAEPLSFEDAAAATESLRERAAWVQRHYPEAAGNLLVAQHRDTRRYAAARAARRLTNTPEFSAGDYVYIKKLKVDNTLQFQYYDTILRVKSVGPLGVAVLIGRDGTQQLRRRVEQLAPCHLDVDPAIEPQLFRPGKDLACEACSSPGQPARMLLCDGCNQGWHTHCLRPPLREVPTGAWLCPRCLAHLSQQPPTEEATREWPEQLGQLLFPKASTRRLDDEARQIDGTVVTRRVRTGRGKGAGETEQKALLQFRGALYRPHYFAVKWPGEVEMEYWTLEHVRRRRARA